MNSRVAVTVDFTERTCIPSFSTACEILTPIGNLGLAMERSRLLFNLCRYLFERERMDRVPNEAVVKVQPASCFFDRHSGTLRCQFSDKSSVSYPNCIHKLLELRTLLYSELKSAQMAVEATQCLVWDQPVEAHTRSFETLDTSVLPPLDLDEQSESSAGWDTRIRLISEAIHLPLNSHAHFEASEEPPQKSGVMGETQVTNPLCISEMLTFESSTVRSRVAESFEASVELGRAAPHKSVVMVDGCEVEKPAAGLLCPSPSLQFDSPAAFPNESEDSEAFEWVDVVGEESSLEFDSKAREELAGFIEREVRELQIANTFPQAQGLYNFNSEYLELLDEVSYTLRATERNAINIGRESELYMGAILGVWSKEALEDDTTSCSRSLGSEIVVVSDYETDNESPMLMDVEDLRSAELELDATDPPFFASKDTAPTFKSPSNPTRGRTAERLALKMAPAYEKDRSDSSLALRPNDFWDLSFASDDTSILSGANLGSDAPLAAPIAPTAFARKRGRPRKTADVEALESGKLRKKAKLLTESKILKRRGRSPKVETLNALNHADSSYAPPIAASSSASVPKRRGRPPKVKVLDALPPVDNCNSPPVACPGPVGVPRKRGRPPKVKTLQGLPPVDGCDPQSVTFPSAPAVPRRRGRPPKVKVLDTLPPVDNCNSPPVASRGPVSVPRRRGRPLKAKTFDGLHHMGGCNPSSNAPLSSDIVSRSGFSPRAEGFNALPPVDNCNSLPVETPIPVVVKKRGRPPKAKISEGINFNAGLKPAPVKAASPKAFERFTWATEPHPSMGLPPNGSQAVFVEAPGFGIASNTTVQRRKRIALVPGAETLEVKI
ncbi:hypothetical protein L0F63_004199 [Massospora cicadina]|nr:hypothetical protein L0F63_004199 [Massospora cicadina]